MKALYIGLSFCFLISCSTPETANKKLTISKDPKGIGPIKQLDLTTINDSVMKVGLQLFNNECSNCHTMEYKNTGPDISDILAIRKPEWVVNFLLNKEEMLLRDSLAIKTRILYEQDCGASINEEQKALNLLEYLRIYQIWLHEFYAL